MTKIIAIASAKGGVGKTTAAVNIGTALARFGREAVVVDANLSTPNIGIQLGAPITPSSVHDAVKGKESIRKCIYTHPSGVRIAPASIALHQAKNPGLKKLKSVIKDLEGTHEVVIVDSAPGLGDEMVSAVSAADEVVVITTADLPAVTDAIKTIETIEANGVTVVGVALNRVRNDKHEMKADEVEAMLERPVIASIPEDENIRAALKKSEPVVFLSPDAPSSTAYKELAALLIGQKYEVLTKIKK